MCVFVHVSKHADSHACTSEGQRPTSSVPQLLFCWREGLLLNWSSPSN